MAGGIAAVIVAAGRGTRAGGALPKTYRALAGEPMIRFSLSLFSGNKQIDVVQPVIHADDVPLYGAAAHGLDLLAPVFGGATRQASVRAGLEALIARPPDIVLVHDAARPFASAALVSRGRGGDAGAAIPGVGDRHGQGGRRRRTCRADGRSCDVARCADAAGLQVRRPARRRISAPQAAGRDDFSDDAALAEWAGHHGHVFEGEAANSS